MRVLISDTFSVLIDPERGSLLDAAFRMPFEFAVPDLLYERELKEHGGDRLCRLGLRVSELDGDGVARALRFRRGWPALSLSDCFALALAAGNGWTLLTGDAGLRRLADAEHVDCHGVLWLMDEMLRTASVSARELHDGLAAVSAHPRCRLPKGEARARLARYAALVAAGTA